MLKYVCAHYDHIFIFAYIGLICHAHIEQVNMHIQLFSRIYVLYFCYSLEA